MTVMAEATQLTVKPDMPMGARLRLTNVETGQTHEGTVTGTFRPEDYGVTLDTAPPWQTSTTIASTFIRTGQITVERLDGSDTVAETPVPVPVVVGMRIRVRQESATGPDLSYIGQPPTAYQGQCGSVSANRSIAAGATFDDHRTVIQVDLDNGEQGVGVYVGWIEPDTRPLAAGDYVRIQNGQLYAYEGSGYVDQAFRNQVARVIRAADDTGGVHVSVDSLGGQIIHSSYLTRTTAPPEIVDPMEAGTRIATATGKATVVSKSDERLSAYMRGNRGYMSSENYVAAIRDGQREAEMFAVNSVNVVVDVLEGLSPEQQILRLQTLVHRVASYEAVRRDWCHEVNGALAMLNLPDHLSEVDRDLGRALGRDPKLIFQLDTEVEGVPGDDDDDDEDGDCQHDYIADIDVSYYATEGYRVSGATVSVGFQASCNDEDYSEYVTEDMVTDAINNHGSLPRCESLDDWSIDDVNEN